MASRAQREDQGAQLSLWRRLAVTGCIGAIVYLYVLLLRKLRWERNTQTADRLAMASTDSNRPGHFKTAFEPTDWELKPIILIYAGILALLVISTLVLIPAYPNALPDVDRTLRINPPGPRLQTDGEADYRRFRAEEDERLDGYHWVDKQKGVVRIPIEQAMKKLVQTGIPDFPKAQP